MSDQNQHRPWLAWQTAMHQKRIKDARPIFLNAEQKFSPLIGDQTDNFIEYWRPAVEWYFNTFNESAASAIITNAIGRHLLSDADLFLHKETSRFLVNLQREFETSRKVMRAFIDCKPILFPADELVRVISHPKGFLYDETWSVAVAQGWQRLVGEVARQAKRFGKSICFVQEELKPISDASPAPFTLSYHTTAIAPKTIHFKEADLPEFYSLDEEGYAGWSSMARQTVDQLPLNDYATDVVEDYFIRLRNRILSASHSKYPQPAWVATPLPSRYVFVALQTTTDRVQALGWVSMFEMLAIVLRRFARTGHAIVIKRHPHCYDEEVSHRLDQLSTTSEIVLRDDNIHQLIAGAEAVISVNSGVGSEASIHLKPIYTFGASDYAAIAHEIHNEEQFLIASSPIRLAVSEATIKRFVFHYRNQWLVDTSERNRLQTAVAQRIITPALGAIG